MNKFLHSFNGRLKLCLLISSLGMLVTLFVSYKNFSEQIHEQAYTRINSLSFQIEETVFESQKMIDNVSRIASYSTPIQLFLLSSSPQTVISNLPKTNDSWNFAFSNHQLCKNVYLYSDMGRYLSYNTAYWSIFRTKLKEYGLTENVSFTEAFFSDVFYISDDGKTAIDSPERDKTPYAIYFFPVYSALPSMDNSRNHIVSAILCNMAQLGTVVDEPNTSSYFLMFDNKPAIRVKGDMPPELLLETIVTKNIHEGSLSFAGTNYIVKRISLKNIGADFVYIVEEAEIVGSLYETRNISLLILILISLITIIAAGIVIHQTLLSLNVIIYDTTHLRTPNGLSRIRTPNLSELINMSDSINDLVDRIDASAKKEQETEAKLLKAEIAQNNAELLGYRSQINPHFLFNTMECMRSMAHIYKAEPVEKIVSSMANMFRYSLYSPMTTTLCQEIKHIQNYVNVMQQRYPDKLYLIVDAAQELMDYRIISMILQPIVENSVLHAFPVKQKKWVISVQARIVNGNLSVRIIDNGKGLTNSQIKYLNDYVTLVQDDAQEKSSISLQNIYRRLSLICGEKFQMNFYSKFGCYTAVELIIPHDTIK